MTSGCVGCQHQTTRLSQAPAWQSNTFLGCSRSRVQFSVDASGPRAPWPGAGAAAELGLCNAARDAVHVGIPLEKLLVMGFLSEKLLVVG